MTCAPNTGVPSFVTRPERLPDSLCEVAVRIEIGNAGDVVGLQRPAGDAAGGERNRKHHRFGREHAAAAAFAQLRLAERRVAEAAHVADLVQRDALEVEPVRLAVGRDRPRERGVEEDVGFDERAGRRVDDEARRREHAIEIGPAREPERRHAVVACRGRRW